MIRDAIIRWLRLDERFERRRDPSRNTWLKTWNEMDEVYRSFDTRNSALSELTELSSQFAATGERREVPHSSGLDGGGSLNH